MLRPALVHLLVAALTVACASSGRSRPAGDGERMRVTLYGYEDERRFELVGETHTDRVSWYSQPRSDASRKIQSDDVMEALLERLDETGFGDHAQAGRAPSQGRGLLSWGLEVEEGERTRHWVIGSGSAPGEWQRFQQAMKDFLDLYNLTASFQTIENPAGEGLFREAQARPGRRRP